MDREKLNDFPKDERHFLFGAGTQAQDSNLRAGPFHFATSHCTACLTQPDYTALGDTDRTSMVKKNIPSTLSPTLFAMPRLTDRHSQRLSQRRPHWSL